MSKQIQVGEKVIGSLGYGRWGNRQARGRYAGKDKDGYFMVVEDMVTFGAVPCVKIHRFDDPFNRITFELPADYIKECANGFYKGGIS